MALDLESAGPFHRGELWVQERAGTRAAARRVGGMVRREIAPPIAAFLETARVAAVGAVDVQGRVWASLVVGPDGFLSPAEGDGQTIPSRLHVDACPSAGDALAHMLCPKRVDPSDAAPSVGLMAIDFATRRRVRVNGLLAADTPTDGGFTIVVQQAYVNCPKYIQARAIPVERRSQVPDDGVDVDDPDTKGTALSPSQRTLVSNADTTLVASVGPDGSADASHRGGPRGFIDVLDDARLRIPDYSGNAMFNTLGNLAADSRIGLTIPDFSSGRLVQISGRASINWSEELAAQYLAAERVLDVVIERVVEVRGAFPASWTYLGPSPFNPPARGR